MRLALTIPTQGGRVLPFAELHDLQRRLRNRKVLSVFVDTSGTADGPSWRAKVERVLARLDATPPQLPSGERTARTLCMAHLRTFLESIRDTPRERGWFAYVTTDDVVTASPLDSQLETAAFWQTGIVMAPLLDMSDKRSRTAVVESQPRFAVQTLARSRALVSSPAHP
jgi:hypothetical protein